MNNRKIHYAIHIVTTPERLWQALTSPDALKQNWGQIKSPWSVGSAVTEVDSSGKLLWKGEVLRSEPLHLLSYTFEVSEISEPPTRVTFQLDPPVSQVAPGTSVVRLTVTQEGFAENSKLAPDCARAWTEILSSIKSYLETGAPIPFQWGH